MRYSYKGYMIHRYKNGYVVNGYPNFFKKINKAKEFIDDLKEENKNMG